MKLLILGTTEEEEQIIREINKKIQVDELSFASGILTLENMDQVDGYDAIWIMTNSPIGEAEAKILHQKGVRYILSRATGFDHLDLEALQKYQIKAANVPAYSPNAISEHTILLFLSVLRNMKHTQSLVRKRNFGIDGICGREIRMMTVGVIGCGRIGQLTIRALHGLGGKVLVHSRTVKPEVADCAEFVSLEQIWNQSDAIILHCPVSEQNYHLINQDTLARCKDGLVLVNTARGKLVDGKSVLDGLRKGKVSAFAMDVYETEDDFVRMDFHGEGMKDSIFEQLLQREDVLYTPHVSFLTDQALYEMMQISLENAVQYQKNGTCENELTR